MLSRTTLAVLLGAPLLCSQHDTERKRPPNFVFILADDLGYGDLGCYGQERIRTPHIDRLAREGRRFTQFYSGSTVCAPARCSLMTGKTTFRCVIRGNARMNLPAGEVTVAEVLKDAGYATGLIGKWGLGQLGSEGMPTRQGFDEFFGYLDQRHAHNYYPTHLIRGEAQEALPNVVPDEGSDGAGVATERVVYSHDLFADEALSFVERHAAEPFLLYLALTIPHANNEAGKEGMEVPDLGEYADEDWPEPAKGQAAMIARMDRDVGRLMAKLQELGIDDDTLVIFSSDNGPHSEGGHRAEFFDSNGALRGQKRDLTEGGIRVPLIARWPGRVPAGTTSGHIGAFWDVLATYADLAEAPAPASTDGISFARALLGTEGQREHQHLAWAFYERGGGRALRSGRWKAIQQPILSALRLYDLETDLGEQNDVAGERPEVADQMRAWLDGAYIHDARWQFRPRESDRVTRHASVHPLELPRGGELLTLGIRMPEGTDPAALHAIVRHGDSEVPAQVDGLLQMRWVAPQLSEPTTVEIVIGGKPTKAEGEATAFRFLDGEGVRELRFGDRRIWRHETWYDPERHAATFKTFHHLFASDDTLLTKGPGGEYSHHRGLFAGWVKTIVAGDTYNFWQNTEGKFESQRHREYLSRFVTAGPVFAQCCSDTDWVTTEGETAVSDRRIIRTWIPREGEITHDVSLWLSSPHAVKLSGDPPHAGFQVRAAQSVAEAEACTYLRPDGAVGGENDNWTGCEWMLGEFPIGAGRYAIAILDHRDNPKPVTWNTRSYGRFGAFFEAQLEPEQPLGLRYRVRVFDLSKSHPTREQLDLEARAFAKPASVTVLSSR